jgi:iron complex transport system ATP-binding protein
MVMEKVVEILESGKRDALLDIRGLKLGFKDGKAFRVIFDRVDASASLGEIVALIGSNGRGKSTLLRTLVGLQPVVSSTGKILYGGKRIEEFSNRELSQLISFVSSRAERANHLSVKDMLAINCYYKTNWLGNITDADSKRISQALELVGLAGFENRNSFELSDGEYQRATIAAAIVQDSKIIILDEPTAFLDIANRFIITQLLQKIAHEWGKLIIFSTHDLQLAIDMCDKIWLMTGDGFYDNTPQQLMDCGAFGKLFDDPRMIFNQTTRSFEMLK